MQLDDKKNVHGGIELWDLAPAVTGTKVDNIVSPNPHR